MINKKAQKIGMGLTFVVTILSIIIVMIIFVSISKGLSTSPPRFEEATLRYVEEDNPLFTPVNIELNGENKTLLIYDLLNGKLNIFQVMDILTPTLKNEGDCFLYYSPQMLTEGSSEIEVGKIMIENNRIKKIYRPSEIRYDQTKLIKIFPDTGPITITKYFFLGRCELV